jgi:hypothetical protein
VDGSAPAFVRDGDVLLVWSGQTIRRMAPGFDLVMADLYWLRTVQYFGSERVFAKEARFDLLRPLIEITTELDPRLEIAYRYGATFLAEPYPTGAGKPADAIEILQAGQRRNPQSWRLWQYEGLFRYQFQHDSVGAGAALSAGAQIPGAPQWMRSLEAVMLTKAGDRATARALWQQMQQSSEERFMKENAFMHLLHLNAQDTLDALRTGIALFEKQRGRKPASLAELAAAGLAPGPVVDPTREPFRYDAATGAVSIAPTSKLFQMERE